MKNRFVLGIFVVLCLQVCFQAFLALQRADERYSRIPVGTQATSTVGGPTYSTEIASLPGEDALGDARAPHHTVIRHFERTTPRPEVVLAKFEQRRPLEKERFLIAAKLPVTRSIIKGKDLPKNVRTEAPDRNKGFFLARALPIIKKPYDLFKFVGSRLK